MKTKTTRHIRPYRPGDEEAVYEVCLRTGDAGQDATALYPDSKALGNLYVGPYLHHEPELAFVLEDDEGVCGYVLGTRESGGFYDWFKREWLPALTRIYQRPSAPKNGWSAQDRVVAQYFEPEIHYPSEFQEYPAHLHIDLLPRAQGQGWGSKMIGTWLMRAVEEEIPGVHLVVAETNARARRFYRKLGFHELSGKSDSVYMGKLL